MQVGGAIRDFRRRLEELLLAEAGIVCNAKADVLMNDRGRCYCLAPSIRVRDWDAPAVAGELVVDGLIEELT